MIVYSESVGVTSTSMAAATVGGSVLIAVFFIAMGVACKSSLARFSIDYSEKIKTVSTLAFIAAFTAFLGVAYNTGIFIKVRHQEMSVAAHKIIDSESARLMIAKSFKSNGCLESYSVLCGGPEWIPTRDSNDVEYVPTIIIREASFDVVARRVDNVFKMPSWIENRAQS